MIQIEVKVRPGARASALEETCPGVWSAQLKAPPVDGKANEELVALLAKRFGCRKADVTIVGGLSSRLKRVRIDVKAR